jgi:ubiquinone/menaquinone biosynthesis C-methylase UbiE
MSDPPSTASGYFGSMAEDYDSLIRRAVPRYEEMVERLVDYLPADSRDVLELGCGTGALTLELATAFPACRLTVVDASSEMVALTRARLSEHAPNVAGRATFVTSFFEDLSLPARSMDLVTSGISLHHVQDKASLYRRIHGWVRPGGSFRYSDQMYGGTEENHQVNWAHWLAFCRAASHCSEEELEGLVAHAEEHDHYVSVREHLRLLESAGFERVDCVWRNNMWGIVTGEA